MRRVRNAGLNFNASSPPSLASARGFNSRCSLTIMSGSANLILGAGWRNPWTSAKPIHGAESRPILSYKRASPNPTLARFWFTHPKSVELTDALRSLRADEIAHLIVLDATWQEARKMERKDLGWPMYRKFTLPPITCRRIGSGAINSRAISAPLRWD